jgi:SAM-dependent methyltransferase
VTRHYENEPEGERLQRSRVRRLERDATLQVLSRYVSAPQRVLELGAGHGTYSLHFARQGCRVVATDLVPSQVAVIRDQARNHDLAHLDTQVADAVDLGQFADCSFDVVLCLGPFYHLRTVRLRRRCLTECRRVVRPGGIVALSYITAAFAVAHLAQTGAPVSADQYLSLSDPDDERSDYPDDFVNIAHFSVPAVAAAEVEGAELTVVEHAGLDGVFGFFAAALEAVDDAAYRAYREHHLRTCSTPGAAGASGHNLIVASRP